MAAREAGFLLDIPIDHKTLYTAIQDALIAIQHKSPPVVFACANPHSLVVAQRDASFQSALTQANLVVADGVGVTFMARLVRVQIGPRITGTDYFLAVMKALQHRGRGRVFFFGSSQHVLDLIAKRFAADCPSLTLCGAHSPPFGSWGEEENAQMVAMINRSRPDVLWVGMTAPKQETWVEANRHQLDVPVIGSIGAVFDFYAGTYPRAPQWLCRIGMEWAYRMMREPRRMWRRNVLSAPRFVALVVWRHVLGFGKHL